MKPIQDAIEALHREDLCPRLHVDVTHADAVCPDFVRDKWGQRLVIDLDPSYPLDLAFTPVGVEVDLSFGGYVTRCTFPWAAIYLVADRDTGRGQVFAGHIPASLRHEFGLPQRLGVDPKRPKVQDDTSTTKGSRRRRRRRPEAESEPTRPLQAIGLVEAADGGADAAEPASEGESADASDDGAEAAENTQSVAEARRSAFKVIDGGDA